jgi:hypothetical protein
MDEEYARQLKEEEELAEEYWAKESDRKNDTNLWDTCPW